MIVSRKQTRVRVFLVAFALFSGTGLIAIAASHVVLARAGLLAPPPYVATWCIDQKLNFLSRAELETVDVAAIGSSAAWRNLDMTVIESELGVNALNAAPCFLKVDQTAYLAEFLLPRMPELDVLVAVFLPRDFEACIPQETAFFDARLASGVFENKLPRWTPYVTGFRPLHLITYAYQRANGSGGFEVAVHEDGLGSTVFAELFDWWPDLSVSEDCYAALTRLEQLTSAHGVRLVVALSPLDPAWKIERDPEGTYLAAWRSRLAESVTLDVLIIDGKDLGLQSDRFADAMHLLHPNEAQFSRQIARSIAVLFTDLHLTDSERSMPDPPHGG